MKSLGSVNIMVWRGVSVGIRDSCCCIQVDHKHAISSDSHLQWSTSSARGFTTCGEQNSRYHSEATAQFLNGSFFPPHCTSWISLQQKHVLLIEFKVGKEPAKVWITSGKRRVCKVRPVLWTALPNPPFPQKKVQVFLAPDSAKFSPS